MMVIAFDSATICKYVITPDTEFNNVFGKHYIQTGLPKDQDKMNIECVSDLSNP